MAPNLILNFTNLFFCDVHSRTYIKRIYKLPILLPYHQGFVGSSFRRNLQICSQNICFPPLTSRRTVFVNTLHTTHNTAIMVETGAKSRCPVTFAADSSNCRLAFSLKKSKHVRELSEEEQESLNLRGCSS